MTRPRFKLWHRDPSMLQTAAAIAIGIFAAMVFWAADLLGVTFEADEE